MRGSLKDQAAAAGVKVTPLAFIIEAAVRAMREFPVLNSQLDEAGQNLIYKKFFNVGFAADTPNGLLVPVIKGADKLDVFAVAKALGELSGRQEPLRRAPAGGPQAGALGRMVQEVGNRPPKGRRVAGGNVESVWLD